MKLYRRPLARALTAAAFVLLCLSAYLFRPAPKPVLLDEAFWLLLAGSLTFWTAVYLNRSGRTQPANASAAISHPLSVSPSLNSGRGPGGGVLLILLGSAAFLVLIEINAGILGIAALQSATSTLQFSLFISGLILITLGAAGTLFPSGRNRTIGEKQVLKVFPTQRLFSLSPQSLVLNPLFWVTVLAFALRAYALGSAVHHLVDEIHFSNAVMNIRPAESTIKLLWPINAITAFPWLFSYMQAWGVDLLGRNLEGLRAISVVVGTLGIPALYFLARELFDRRSALLAALLLAVFPPHIQFSRIGLNNMVDPLFGTLALGFLIRGLKYKRRVDFALGGAALGLTQYFYEGGRLLYPALILLALAWFILVKPRFFVEATSAQSSTRNSELGTQNFFPRSALRPALSTYFLTALLIALPVYSTLIATQKPLDARFQTVGIGGSYWLRVNQLGKPQTLEQHLLLPFLVYVYQPEIALYYGGEQAMLLPYVVPFLLVGVLTLLAYWRAPGVIVLLWLLLASMGNMILTESAIYARYVVAFPALALLAAVGIRTLAALLWPSESRWRRWVTVGLVTVLSIGQVIYFFGPHLGRYNEQLRQTFDSEDAIFRSAAFPRGTQIHIIQADSPGQAYLSGLANYLADNLSVFVLPPAGVTSAYVGALSKSVDHAFFVTPQDTASVALLSQYLKLAGPFTSPYNVPPYRQLLLYYAKAAAG